MTTIAIILTIFAYLLLIGGIVVFFATCNKKPIEYSNLVDWSKIPNL